MALQWAGNRTGGSGIVQCPPANNKAAIRVQNTTGYTLNVASISGIWDQGYPSAKMKGVIYSDSAGSPGALLATTNEKVGITAGVNKLTFAAPVALANGSYCWIGVISDTTCESNTCLPTGTIKYNANTYASGPASSFGTASSATFTYQLWADGDDGTSRLGRASAEYDGGSGVYTLDCYDKFTLGGASSVGLQSMFVYVSGTSSTTKGKCAVYADNAGAPGAKLAQSQEVTGFTAGTWAEFPFAAGTNLAPGTYWLAVVFSANMPTRYATQTGAGKQNMAGLDYPGCFSNSPLLINATPPGTGFDLYASYGAVLVASPRPQIACVT